MKKIDTLINKAEKGDSEAQYQLGKIFAKGEGVKKDLTKSLNDLLNVDGIGPKKLEDYGLQFFNILKNKK